MNITCGTDIIEIDRIKKAIDNNKGFIEKIYTKKEIEYCNSKKIQKYKSFAVRFAAKEAVTKAFGTGFTASVKPKEIEILNDKRNKPYVVLQGDTKKEFEKSNVKKIEISLSHSQQYAVAYAIMITGEEIK